MRNALPVFALILSSFTAPAFADPTHKTLADLQGSWARSKADCHADVAGKLARGDIDRVIATSYEMIGICREGIELLFQPQHCTIQSAVPGAGGLTLSGPCQVKGQPNPARFTITPLPSGAIRFNEQDFAQNYFSISGDYVRCSRAYTCTEPLDP